MFFTRVFIIFINSLFIASIVNFDAGQVDQKNLFSNDRTHAQITECALYQITYDFLLTRSELNDSLPLNSDTGFCKINKKQVRDMIGRLGLNFEDYQDAVDTILKANGDVDVSEAYIPNAHFDDEMFYASSERIQNFKYISIVYSQNESYPTARKYFGRMLHTIQDFYSHSNWVNFEPRNVNPNLGRSLDLGPVATIDERTCLPCPSGSDCSNQISENILKNKILTSGYFNAFSAKKPVGKCSHGGFLDKTIDSDAKGRGINKDSLSSPLGDFHFQAADLAYKTSFEILKDFWAIIGDENFSSFLGFRGKSLALCIDTTGSMTPSIESVKLTAIKLVNDSNAYNYILSPFNDPTWGPLTVTQDPNILVQEINKLYAHDGGDEPELFYHGVLDAVKACEPNSLVYAFTDAPAKDEYLRPTTEILAREKGVRINPILIVHGKSKKSNYIEDYESLARVTGGFALFSTNSDIADISDLIVQQQTQENIQSLFVADIDKIESSSYNFEFYVDESVKTIYFSISSSSMIPSVINISDSTGFSISEFNYTFDTLTTKSFFLESPKNGNWKINFGNSDYPFSLKVTGLSAVEAVIKIFELKENIMHPSYFEVNGNPKFFSNLVSSSVVENLKNKIKSSSLFLMYKNSTIIKEISSSFENGDDDASIVVANLTVPDQDFRIKIRLNLENGEIIERYNPSLFMPTSLDLKIDINVNQSSVIKIGETMDFDITVENIDQATAAPVSIAVYDSLSLLDLNEDVAVEANSTYKITLSLKVPNETVYEGQTDLITISVANKLSNLDTNYDIIYVQILANEVRFDLIPQCVILENGYNSSCDIKKCSSLNYWNAKLRANDTGSGLVKINAIRNQDSNKDSFLNITHEDFSVGSKEPLDIEVLADCCTQNFDVFVSDIYGNVGRCKFFVEKIVDHANSGVIIEKNFRLLMLNLIIVIYLTLKIDYF